MLALAPISEHKSTMQSCIYHGTVEHTRLKPHLHHFQYQVFMMYLDLAELDQVFAGRWLWSTSYPAVAWFRRRDHLGNPSQPLNESVRDLVEQHVGCRPTGPIRLLTNLRYFGYVINPVSYYYCYDDSSERVQTIVAEIHNTPWGERHCYVITRPVDTNAPDHFLRNEHAKSFHVSPFMPMDLRYHWQFSQPGKELEVKISLSKSDEHIFHASLVMKQLPITSSNLAATLLRFPCMTARVVTAIYWQAFRLWLKKTPYFVHPKAR